MPPALPAVPFPSIPTALAALLGRQSSACSLLHAVRFFRSGSVYTNTGRGKRRQSVRIRPMLSCVEQLFKVVPASLHELILCAQPAVTAVPSI